MLNLLLALVMAVMLLMSVISYRKGWLLQFGLNLFSVGLNLGVLLQRLTSS